MQFIHIWQELTEIQKDRTLIRAKYREWKRLNKTITKAFGLDYAQTKAFGLWAMSREWDTAEEISEEISEGFSEEDTLDAPDEPLLVDSWEHNQTYWYDQDRKLYVVHLPSQKKPLAIPESKWKSIREAYSNWDGTPSSVNEICRKQGLSRRTVVELLRVMGVTHDSSPYTDEEFSERGEGELIEDLLRKKEERVLMKAQQKEWSRVKKDADKYRSASMIANDTFNRLLESTKKYSVPKAKWKKPTKESYSIVISPTDFHWGKYAPVYGGDPYNRHIAKQRLWEATLGILSQMKERGAPDYIYLALGGDGLHIDNQNKTTTRGTLQDCDGTPEELAWTWVEMCREYVDLVRQFAPVKLFVVAGNHDYYTATLLRAAMKGWFYHTDEVDVCESMLNRQYDVYGDNLISFLHGDIGSVKDWPAIIAGEEREKWGITKNKFIFTGHFHTERELPTFGNVTVYRMPSLAGTDAWHASKGYKSRKALVGYVVSKKRGVVGQIIEPVEE